MAAIDDMLSDVQAKSATVTYSVNYSSYRQALQDIGALTQSIAVLLAEIVSEEETLNTSEFPPPSP